MSQSLFSKEMQDQLKTLKSQLKTQGKSEILHTEKPEEPTALPSHKQIKQTLKRLDNDQIDDDKLLFIQAMSGVKPIKDNNAISPTKSTQQPDSATLAKRLSAEGKSDDQISDQLSDMQALLNPVAGEAYLAYKIPTLQTKVFNQLKQGKIHWFDAVDLHGSSVEEARQAVLTLIRQAKQNNENCVKIVHGKGSDSILKTYVNGWLRQIPDVLAFCSAPTKQGGNGAVLVLIKRQTPKT